MMKRLVTAVAMIAFIGVVSTLQAADDPTGAWKWTAMYGGNSFDVTLKLKLDGDKLTGAVVGQNNQETPISEASFKDGKVSFSIVRERDGQKFTIKYNGTLSGDTITGKSERERDGQKQSNDWVAKRQK
jgi:hypothetical protein